jgi:hypothetical protein
MLSCRQEWVPDLIRHPLLSWIPAFAGKTGLVFIVAGVITGDPPDIEPQSVRIANFGGNSYNNFL